MTEPAEVPHTIELLRSTDQSIVRYMTYRAVYGDARSRPSLQRMAWEGDHRRYYHSWGQSERDRGVVVREDEMALAAAWYRTLPELDIPEVMVATRHTQQHRKYRGQLLQKLIDIAQISHEPALNTQVALADMEGASLFAWAGFRKTGPVVRDGTLWGYVMQLELSSNAACAILEPSTDVASPTTELRRDGDAERIRQSQE